MNLEKKKEEPMNSQERIKLLHEMRIENSYCLRTIKEAIETRQTLDELEKQLLRYEKHLLEEIKREKADN